MTSNSLIECFFFHFSQENHHKRKTDQHLSPLKKSRQSDVSISTNMETISIPIKSPDRSQRHCITPTVKGIPPCNSRTSFSSTQYKMKICLQCAFFVLSLSV